VMNLVVTRYKFDKADWSRYEQMCRENLQTEMIRNSTDPILKFNETVISIAEMFFEPSFGDF
jgi:hypothetical protein